MSRTGTIAKDILRISNGQKIDVATALDAYADGEENNQRRQEHPGPNTAERDDKLLLAIGFRGKSGALVSCQRHGTHVLEGRESNRGEPNLTKLRMALPLVKRASFRRRSPGDCKL